MYKIKTHEIFLDEYVVIHLKVTKVKVKQPDYINPDKVGYDTFEYIKYRETEKEVLREFFNLTMNSNLSDYVIDNDEDSNKITKKLLEKFVDPKTMNLYPEIFI